LNYAQMLKSGIQKSNFSLTQVCFQLAKRDVWIDKGVLSKMQNGKVGPAKDDVNIVLAEILKIDSVTFRVAAAKEIIPCSLFELISKTG